MGVIDSKTILLLMAMGQIMSVAIFSYYLLTNRNDKSEIRLYTLGKILQLISPVIYLVYGGNPGPGLMAISVLFFYPGMAIEAFCLVYLDREPNKKNLIRLLVLSTLFFTLYAITSKNIEARAVVTSTYYSIIFIVIILRSIFSKNSTRIQKLVGWFSFTGLAINLYRIIFVLLSHARLEIYDTHFIQILFILQFVAVAYFYPLLFLLILHERNLKQVMELNTTKDKFLKIIGHDLRSPFAQIVQASRVIENNLDELEKDRLVDMVKVLSDTSEKGYRLLDTLLDWAASQTGHLSCKKEPVFIGSLVRENIELASKPAEEKQIELVVMEQTEDAVALDKNMISTVLRNLLANAVKFTHPGGRIEIRSILEKDFLLVSVKDNGKGMSPEVSRKIFDLDNIHVSVGTRDEKGTGLGLILCREFIEKHQGKIWVESEEGKGADFRFRIPVRGGG
ncbi:MAG: sensor histidine kinase [Bacteroidota bacterium]